MAHLFDTPGSNQTIKWHPDPDFRGTFSIITSCMITLVLGVYSAVHLNLPGKPGSFTEAFLRRLAWIACSLLAPEALILVAYEQRQAAKRISIKVNEVFRARSNAENDAEAQKRSLQHPWTMTHSFWALMGGIAIDDSSESCTPADHPPKLTEKGVASLLQFEPDLLPDISEDELQDKSKGNSFTKMLACLQATWFCVSCLARVIQGLPLSLFELNTFTHAVCTVIVYMIWWKKPLDVERPLLIKDERIRPLLAYMWMSSKTSVREKIKSNGNTSYTVGQDPEFEAITVGKHRRNTTIDARCRTSQSTSTLEAFKVTPTTCLPGTNFYVNKDSTRWKVQSTTSTGDEYNANTYSHTYFEPAEFKLKLVDIRRWQLGQQALEMYSLPKPDKDLDLLTVKPVPEFFEPSSTHQEGDGWLTQKSYPWSILGFAVLAACYGALHALGWNAKFPNRRERILWRVSSLLIASPAGVWLLVVVVITGIRISSSLASLIVKGMRRVKNGGGPELVTAESQATATARASLEVISDQQATATVPINSTPNGKKTQPDKSWFWSLFWKILQGLAMALLSNALVFLYFPARAYIVVESFRMVFYLPPEAFRATSWENYLPHLG